VELQASESGLGEWPISEHCELSCQDRSRA
jgi:hypothetical protein